MSCRCALTSGDLWLNFRVTEALGMDATPANSHSFNGFNGCLWMFIVPQIYDTVEDRIG